MKGMETGWGHQGGIFGKKKREFKWVSKDTAGKYALAIEGKVRR